MSDQPWLAPKPDTSVPAGHVPGFSVIVAAYEAADVIGEAIDSALAQRPAPLEIVVCDDGSSDDLAGALAPYGDRVRLLRQANGGEGAAKNTACRAATGEWVVILDADDTFAPGRLDALGRLAAARPDLDVLTTDATLEIDGQAMRRCYHEGFAFETDDQRRAILDHNFVFGLAAVRRARWLEVGGFDTSIRYTADWDLWLRMILGGSRVGLVDAPLARYRISPGNLSSQRALMLEGGLVTLAKAAARHDLSSAERDVLDRATRSKRRDLALVRARASVAGQGPGRRRDLARVLVGPDQTPGSRGKAAAAIVFPGRAARRLADTEGELTAGLRLPSESAPDPLRVVAYCEGAPFGGAERSLELLLGGLDPLIDVRLIAVDWDVAARLGRARPGMPVHLVAPAESKADVRAILQRVRLLRRLRPHIVHVSLQTPWNCQGTLAAALLTPGAQVVAVEQLPQPTKNDTQRQNKRRVSRRLAAHIAVGDRAAQELAEWTGVPLSSLRTIHNGLPDEGCGPSTRASRPVIGAVGRLVPEKGLDLLIEAVAALPEADALIVGEGPERPRLERLIKELDLGGRVTLLGAVEDARRLLPDFDIFAMPSRSEGFPLAIVEAMLCGLPVVATDVGSIREAVIDDETGLLLEPEDVPGLESALRRLANDPEACRRLGAGGRARAQRLFTASAMIAAYERLYAELRT